MMMGVRVAVGALCAWGAATTAAPVLTSNPPVGDSGYALSDTGYYALSWVWDGDGVETDFVLEESRSCDFSKPKLIYQGPDHSTALSGLLDGEYFYRVRAGDGAWAEPIKIVVRHRSLKESIIYLVIGAAVFLATAVLVVAGHFAHRREGPQT